MEAVDSAVIRVLHFPEGDSPQLVELKLDDLEGWQALVEGNLESVRLKDGYVVMCNEDGISLEMDVNRFLPPAITGWFDPWRSAIRGPFFVMNDDETSLEDDQVQALLHVFGETLAPSRA